MRILLIAPFACISAKEDAMLLEMRGYDVVTFYELHLSTYRHNQGMCPPDYMVNRFLTLEVLEGALVVLHPEATEKQERDMDGICSFTSRRIIRLEDVPLTPAQASDELLDHLNIVGELISKKELALIAETAIEQCRFQFRYDRNSNMRWLRERLRMLRGGFLRWEERANRFLSGTKNPVSRAQHDAARTATVKPYKLVTIPPTVTG